MNSDELVGLISHFDSSWEKLRQNLVYQRGSGWFVRESHQPFSQPADVVDQHLSKRSPAEHPIDDSLAPFASI